MQWSLIYMFRTRTIFNKSDILFVVYSQLAITKIKYFQFKWEKKMSYFLNLDENGFHVQLG